MSSSEIAGAIIVGLPAILIAWLALWRRNRPVFWFAMALTAVGLGYLGSTGALADIADTVINSFPFPLPMAG
jgi:hypothetical protein